MNAFVPISGRHAIPVSIAAEPLYNALNSMALLGQVERLPALDVWVVRTAAGLSTEQLHANRLIFGVLIGALLPDRDWPDFPSYLADLAAQAPAALRDRALQQLEQSEEAPADDPLLAEARALLNDPAALHDLVIGHLHMVWDGGLADEWRHVQPFIQRIPGVVQHKPTADAATILGNLRTFIAGPAGDAAGVEQIICVPSPHVGRYVIQLRQQNVLRLFFHGQSNFAVVMRTTPVGRAELLTRLTALADDTRLRILELFANQNELSAQEIMARLDLSQPSVSRHLKQLAPFLVERRGEGASKFYRLGSTQVGLTFHTLEQLLAGAAAEREAPQVDPVDYPRALRGFMDAQGRATAWPTKGRDQRLMTEYMASRFETGRDYTEKEINAVLLERMHPIFKDYAIIRRALYDDGYLDRERDGSRYWRTDRPATLLEESQP
jgi:DNA-binding transcriptional ArsR family regulator